MDRTILITSAALLIWLAICWVEKRWFKPIPLRPKYFDPTVHQGYPIYRIRFSGGIKRDFCRMDKRFTVNGMNIRDNWYCLDSADPIDDVLFDFLNDGYARLTK